MIIRIAKNSLFNVVNEVSQRYFLFLFFSLFAFVGSNLYVKED
ncbi:hypothetical protein LTSEMIS_0940 [Salmonella enterica subsp. enterica serovar Mississippi str. A4-633]|nr:hypothetical protein LTSEMIS_0940 [Salmonella enterica subsp. enterica serovar Mississippi str. A4-633]